MKIQKNVFYNGASCVERLVVDVLSGFIVICLSLAGAPVRVFEMPYHLVGAIIIK